MGVKMVRYRRKQEEDIETEWHITFVNKGERNDFEEDKVE